MTKQKKLLYIYPNLSTFVRKDIAFLSQHYSVKSQHAGIAGPAQAPWVFLKQLFFLLRHLWKCKAVFVMFGGYHAFFPTLLGRLFGKRVFIILGGTDCVSFPSIDYGTFRKPLQGWFTGRSYRMATRLVPVHASLMGRTDHYYDGDAQEQGVKYFVKNLKTPYTTIHNGYDPNNWDVSEVNKMPNTFITVAAIGGPYSLVLKGIDLMLEVARQRSDCHFVIVGFKEGAERPEVPSHVELKPFVTPEELRTLLSTAQFYCQLSISEGFPNAICEGMLAECIPIGSKVAGIPDIIGDTGLILEKRDAAALNALIDTAIALPNKAERGRQARAHIAREFHLSLREQAYLDLVEKG